MSVYKGSAKVGTIYSGGTKIDMVYKGSQLVYRAWQGQTFGYTGNFQAFVVPTGLYKMRCEVVAARGQQGWSSGNTGWHYAPPGKGGKVDCILSVTPGQILYVYVGYAGPDQTNFDCQTPKYNASDIRTNNAGILDASSLQSRLIVAGGGGNGAKHAGGYKVWQDYGWYAGDGGGLIGGTGNGSGTGGTQTTGGAHAQGGDGHDGANGGFGLGGAAHVGFNVFPAGAGGAGWYGGGGGASYWFKSSYANSQAGGGGSSYTHPTLCTDVVHTQGANNEITGYVKLLPA